MLGFLAPCTLSAWRAFFWTEKYWFSNDDISASFNPIRSNFILGRISWPRRTHWGFSLRDFKFWGLSLRHFLVIVYSITRNTGTVPRTGSTTLDVNRTGNRKMVPYLTGSATLDVNRTGNRKMVPYLTGSTTLDDNRTGSKKWGVDLSGAEKYDANLRSATHLDDAPEQCAQFEVKPERAGNLQCCTVKVCQHNVYHLSTWTLNRAALLRE